MSDVKRRRALGCWGEKKAAELFGRAGFLYVRDLNSDAANHPFADVFAERGGERFIVGVKTRNKYTAAGPLNAAYNVCKKGSDLSDLASRYGARLACLAVQVNVEVQSFSAFFVPMSELTAGGSRYSIPMTPKAIAQYECLARDEYDPAIKLEWSNQVVSKKH